MRYYPATLRANLLLLAILFALYQFVAAIECGVIW